jgi:hypothetical protein
MSVIEQIRELDTEARADFETHVDEQIAKAQTGGYSLVVCLLKEVDGPEILPSQQGEKSIWKDAVYTFRESTKAYGPILFFGYEQMGLIQPKWDRLQADDAVAKFQQALDTAPIQRDGKPAKFATFIAVFPEDGDNAPALMKASLCERSLSTEAWSWAVPDNRGRG